MAALVQSFPQQTGSVTLLQTRPSSSSASIATAAPAQHQGSRNSQLPRNMYAGGSANVGSYRGHPSLSPVAPYAFTSTPSLSSGGNMNRPGPPPQLRPENRAFSAPAIPHGQQAFNPGPGTRQRYPPAASTSTSTSSSASSNAATPQSKDDSSLPSPSRGSDAVINRPLSSMSLSSSSPLPYVDAPSPIRPSPDRYRRNQRRPETAVPIISTSSNFGQGTAAPSGSGMAAVGHLYLPPGQQGNYNLRNSNGGRQRPLSSVDDLQIARQQTAEQAKRYRRRSMSGLETGLSHFSRDPQQQMPSPHPNAFIAPVPILASPRDKRPAVEYSRPRSSHAHNGSSESVSSTRSSSRPPSRRDHGGTASAADSKPPATPTRVQETKRSTNPSPLSKPMAMSPNSPDAAPGPSSPSPAKESRPTESSSPAVQHLTAINKEEKKKSRLRRAFSFGSASELRRASAQNSHEKNVAANHGTQAATKSQEEEDLEQEAIARKQEASGLGESIYSGQGHFYTGSTDNLSISSTASSASVMIRKMGQGVKKSTRSLVGLFRPKSVVGVPTVEPAAGPSVAQVSMVTVEAERERVNVNADPHDQARGGTGFPRLERNSLDAGDPSLTASQSDSVRSSDLSRSRRSIVGGEKERAEVLAAVKKGILKRSGTDSGNSSPVNRPSDPKPTDFVLPSIPHANDTPHSSAPSTPNDENPPRSGHRRTDSIQIEEGQDDYFMSIARLAVPDSKSTPVATAVARNISFSPRIQFHDTWPSGEYDRRGEIATCNRLTPVLAQQIKEELNTFKMEMEVHESSKVYTHFF